jgi:hypothetical protein
LAFDPKSADYPLESWSNNGEREVVRQKKERKNCTCLLACSLTCPGRHSCCGAELPPADRCNLPGKVPLETARFPEVISGALRPGRPPRAHRRAATGHASAVPAAQCALRCQRERGLVGFCIHTAPGLAPFESGTLGPETAPRSLSHFHFLPHQSVNRQKRPDGQHPSLHLGKWSCGPVSSTTRNPSSAPRKINGQTRQTREQRAAT